MMMMMQRSTLNEPEADILRCSSILLHSIERAVEVLVFGDIYFFAC